MLIDFSQFGWHKCELDLCVSVAIDFSDSLKAHCCDKFIEDNLSGPFDFLVILGKFLGGNEWDGATLCSFDVDFGRKSALIVNLDILSARLAEDNISKVAVLLLNFDKGLLARANEGNLDETRLRENREEAVNVFIELRCEGNCDRG